MTSILKVDTIQDTAGNNIINESSDTITIGASGDTITIPSGATISNLGTASGFGGTKMLSYGIILLPQLY
jgi:ribosomal protein L2